MFNHVQLISSIQLIFKLFVIKSNLNWHFVQGITVAAVWRLQTFILFQNALLDVICTDKSWKYKNILASTQCLAAMDFIVTWVTLFKQFTVCRSSSMYAVRAIACEAIYCKVLWQNCYDRCHNIRTVSLMVGKHQFLSHKEKDEGRDDGRTDGRRIQRSSCVSN